MNILKENLTDIQLKLEKREFPNKQAISQGIVLRILNLLGWQIYDTQVVIPEYFVQGKRVDFALCSPSQKPIIFIEVKQQGRIAGADEHLFNYAFHQEIPFAIVTDGSEWHFYLPAEVGSIEESIFCELDILNREVSDSALKLDRYLNFENIKNGTALESARKDFKDASKARQIKKNIPTAWEKLLNDKDQLLLDLISEKVESLCGFQPESEMTLDFLQSLTSSKNQFSVESKPFLKFGVGENKVSNQSVSNKFKTKIRKKIKVIFPDGEEFLDNTVTYTFCKTILKIGVNKVKELGVIFAGSDLISEERPPLAFLQIGANLFISTHSNTQQKFNVLNQINEILNLGLKIELI